VIEHDSIEISMYGPISGSIIERCDKDGVSLRDSNVDEVERVFFHIRLWINSIAEERKPNPDTYTVSFYYAHFVTVNPEVECRKGRGVDDPQTIGFAREER
jgi:hypothetical protein